MNTLLSDLLFKECFVYIDDIIVFGDVSVWTSKDRVHVWLCEDCGLW